jgi:hypothetical protein
MWGCGFIGIRGQAKDWRHNHLSKTLKEKAFFEPYMAMDVLIFGGNGDPSAMSIGKRAKVRRSFLSSGPNLQVQARSLTFVPGGPYTKMQFLVINCIARILWSR